MAGFFDKLRAHRPRVDSRGKKISPATKPELWVKCKGCGVPIYKKVFEEGLKVCERCGFHHKLTAWERIESLVDKGSFNEWDAGLYSGDPLDFGEEYKAKLENDRRKTGLSDAVACGSATIGGIKVALGVMDFHFRGGSMGSVVGEKITRLLERGREEKLPVVTVTSSGGARMQEGMLSLMQMVRTSAAVRRLSAAAVPYIVVLTDPTTAGVAASFASLGDVILAEPKAIIGFSGARVIEQTIRQKLPPGFQTSEFYLAHGFIDKVVPRRELKRVLSHLLSLFVVNQGGNDEYNT